MKEDLNKLVELAKNDETLMKKLQEAAKNYDGEQTEEAFFNSVVAPIAKEAGLSLSLDDLKLSAGELNLDEMAQVGGGGGYGASTGGCVVIGGGLGAGGGYDQTHGGVSGQLCIIIGVGWGQTRCMGEGESETIHI